MRLCELPRCVSCSNLFILIIQRAAGSALPMRIKTGVQVLAQLFYSGLTARASRFWKYPHWG